MSGNPTAGELQALLAQSALPQRQGNLVSYNPVAQHEKVVADAVQAKKVADQTSADQSLALLTQNRKAANPSGGGGGILGTLLNNPIGKGLTGALSKLDVPRSWVTAAAYELGHAVEHLPGGSTAGDHFRAQGRAVKPQDKSVSLSRLVKNAESGKGFGTYVAENGGTDNPWLSRAVGFTGDVALDPLTYLTFGAGKFAGNAGRIAAGEKVAAALGEEAGAKVGRLGVMGANAAERQAAFAGMKGAEDLAQPGLRFAGQRIPGTGRLAEVVGGGLSKGRAAVGDTHAGQLLRSIRAPKGLEEAYKILASGEGDAGVAFDTIKHVRDTAAEKGMFTNQFSNVSDKLARDVKKAGNGEAVFRALDEGHVALDSVAHAPEARALLDEAHGLASQSIPALGKRENFAPHVWTQEARKALRGDTFSGVRQQIGMDVTEATGGAVKRVIHPGSKLTMPDGSIVEFVGDTASGAVSARQINEKLAGVLGVKKVVENDITKVLHPYIEGMGESVGRAIADARAGKVSGLGGMVNAVDKAATKAAGKTEAKALGKTIKVEGKVDQGIVRDLSKTGTTAQKTVVDQLHNDLATATAELSTAKAAEQQAIGASTGLRAERQRVTAEAQQRVSAAQTNLDARISAGTETTKQYAQIDAAHEAATSARFDAREARVAGEQKVTTVKASLKRAEAIVPNPTKQTAAAFGKVHKELDAVMKLAGDTPEVRQLQSLMTTYAKGVADLRDGHTLNVALTQMQKAAAKGEVQPVLKKMIQDGYEKIGESLLGSEAPIVKKELAASLRKLQIAIDDPKGWRIVDKYTQYFKTWATTSVGFHVRNGMQAFFMNATDGVTAANMGRGISLWGLWEKDKQAFLDNLPEYITKEQANDALRAVFASGGGQGQFGQAELRAGTSKLVDNTVTRTSRKLGGKVEGVARMGMAVDTILAGGTWEEASARIARIHFDYSQVSKFDAKVKRIIPFWTFLSRNVPMQVQQMFLKPRMYQTYKHLADNMGHGTPGDMIPLSWQEAGAFKVTNGVYLAPDLAHLQIANDIGKLTSNPQRLLADANPLLKVPFETLIAKRKMFSDTPFKQGGVESVSGSGLGLLEPMLKALGLTNKAADGTEVMNEKLAYAIRSMNPLAAQAQRFLGDSQYYKDKRYQSILNQNGIPVKMLTKGQKDAEQKRRNKGVTVDPKTAALLAYSKG